MQRKTRTVVTVVPCLFFLQRLHEAHSRATVPYVHHNALYRCMLVLFFFLIKSEQKIYTAFVLIKNPTMIYSDKNHNS